MEIFVSREVIPLERIIDTLSEKSGPIRIVTWYEGPRGLPKSGADFWKERFLEPLSLRKPDARVVLYSLNGWDFRTNVVDMKASTKLGEAINRTNSSFVRCIYATSFFQWCLGEEGDSLYDFAQGTLPLKRWAISLSEGKKPADKTVAEVFAQSRSLLDCLRERDVATTYSLLQYLEGTFLVSEAIKEALSTNRNEVEVVFVLPNDEGKYYQDLETELETMLRLEFGEAIDDLTIRVSFQFFQFGDDLAARPYIDKRPESKNVGVKEVDSYFAFLGRVSR